MCITANGVYVLPLKTVAFNEDSSAVIIIDQTLLPSELIYIQLRKPDELFHAIKTLQVRGAPAIGVFAALGIYVAVRNARSKDDLLSSFNKTKELLLSARPTAVNLSWALGKMHTCLLKNIDSSLDATLNALYSEAVRIMDEDIASCRAIGLNGAQFLKDGDSVLTHCNAGCLATAMYGTALSPIYTAAKQGKHIHVYADETRPLLQGARLTAFELQSAGIETTLICDNMASDIMSRKLINAVFVGCDRVAGNGDTANKIGTSGLAVLAKYYGIPFYVCGPVSSIDTGIKDGSEIDIEHRDPGEITGLWYSRPMAPDGIKVYNPAFDVTDNALITAIITDRGLAFPPFRQSIHDIIAGGEFDA